MIAQYRFQFKGIFLHKTEYKNQSGKIAMELKIVLLLKSLSNFKQKHQTWKLIQCHLNSYRARSFVEFA